MTPPDTTGFDADVIVIGAGSAGAAAARRLVDRGARVLLLEAGATDDNPAIHDPARLHELWFAPEDWGYRTQPQPHAADRQLHWPRGKVLGGSSSLNAMIYVRGAQADFDSWAHGGCPGWSWDDVLPIFKRMEDFDGGASELRGQGGPLNIMSRYTADPIHQAIAEAAQQTGLPLNADYNGSAQDGISFMQFSIKDGRRHSTARAYLGPVLGHPGLQVLTGAHVRRVLLEGSRCVGVEWERDGRVEQARAGEVVVSAGAIESPRVLMLSGIGEADHLRSVGIEPVVDLPGVGKNLHDHLLSPVIVTAEREIGPPSPGLPVAQTHMFWRSRPGLIAPDVQPLNFSVPMYEDWMEGPANGFTMQAGMIRPMSRGELRLKSADMRDELLIDAATLECEADVDALEAAVTLCREIAAAPALQEWGAKERYPGPEVRSRADLREYVRRTAITYHHQVGTCKMGLDALAVVDPELRVHGIEGLRVADASVMPSVTSGNTNGPAIMIGERVADFVGAPQQ